MKNSLAAMAVSAIALMGGISHAQAEMTVPADMQKQHEIMMNDINSLKIQQNKILEEHKMAGNNNEKIMNEHKQIMDDHKKIMKDYDQIMSEHKKIMSEHKQIMDDHAEMKREIKDLQNKN